MKFKILSFLLLFSFFYQTSHSQQQRKPLFPIDVEVIKSKSEKSSKPRLYVIDFWATWCAPCIARMPEYIAFAKENLDIDFSFISNENEKLIQSFFKRRPELINGSVNLLRDSNGVYFKKFNIESIPTTVVLDSTGNLLLITAEKISRNLLENLINTSPISLPAKQITPDESIPLLSFSIQKSVLSSSSEAIRLNDRGKLTNYIGKGKTITELFAFADKISPFLVFNRSTNDSTKYDVRFLSEQGQEDLDEILSYYFKVKSEYKTSRIRSLKLSIVNKQLFERNQTLSQEKSSNSDVIDNKIQIVNFNLKMIASLLESSLNIPVVSKEDSAYVDLEIKYPNDVDNLSKFLEGIGLKLESTYIKTKTLHLTKAGEE